MKLRIFVIIILFSGCRNVWMEQVLQPKTITFECNGGGSIEPQIVYLKEKITEPRQPVKTDFIFEGWYTDNASFANKWDFYDTPKGDMTLYAKWRDNQNNQHHEKINSLNELEIYLQSLSPSGAPCNIALNVDDLTGVAAVFNKYPDIFVNLILAGNIDNVGNFDFYNCGSLVSVTIPDGVISIEAGAFSLCSNLSNVTIPNSVAKIDINAFYGCAALVNITVPKSVTYIGECAFYNCGNLTSVTFEGTLAYSSFNDYAFPGDLRESFYAADENNGTPGTYTRPNGASGHWTPAG